MMLNTVWICVGAMSCAWRLNVLFRMGTHLSIIFCLWFVAEYSHELSYHLTTGACFTYYVKLFNPGNRVALYKRHHEVIWINYQGLCCGL